MASLSGGAPEAAATYDKAAPVEVWTCSLCYQQNRLTYDACRVCARPRQQVPKWQQQLKKASLKAAGVTDSTNAEDDEEEGEHGSSREYAHAHAHAPHHLASDFQQAQRQPTDDEYRDDDASPPPTPPRFFDAARGEVAPPDFLSPSEMWGLEDEATLHRSRHSPRKTPSPASIARRIAEKSDLPPPTQPTPTPTPTPSPPPETLGKRVSLRSPSSSPPTTPHQQQRVRLATPGGAPPEQHRRTPTPPQSPPPPTPPQQQQHQQQRVRLATPGGAPPEQQRRTPTPPQSPPPPTPPQQQRVRLATPGGAPLQSPPPQQQQQRVRLATPGGAPLQSPPPQHQQRVRLATPGGAPPLQSPQPQQQQQRVRLATPGGAPLQSPPPPQQQRVRLATPGGAPPPTPPQQHQQQRVRLATPGGAPPPQSPLPQQQQGRRTTTPPQPPQPPPSPPPPAHANAQDDVDARVRASLLAEADRISNIAAAAKAAPAIASSSAAEVEAAPAMLPQPQPQQQPIPSSQQREALMLRWLTLSYLHGTAGKTPAVVAAEAARRSIDGASLVPPPSGSEPMEWFRKEIFTPYGVRAPHRDHAKWLDSYEFAATMYTKRLVRGQPLIRTIPWREHGWATAPKPGASVLARMVTQHQASVVIASRWHGYMMRQSYVKVLLPAHRLRIKAARVIQNWWFWRRHVIRRQARERQRRKRSAFAELKEHRPTAAPWLEPPALASRSVAGNAERVRGLRIRATQVSDAQKLQQERYAGALEKAAENRAAAAMQAAARGWRARMHARQLRRRLEEHFPNGGYQQAAAKVQALIRGWRQRVAYRIMRDELLTKRAEEMRRTSAALVIACAVRRHLARVRDAREREARVRAAAEAEAERREKAMANVGAWVRAHKGRKALLARVARREANAAAEAAVNFILDEVWEDVDRRMSRGPLLELLDRRDGGGGSHAPPPKPMTSPPSPPPWQQNSARQPPKEIANVDGALAYLRSLRVKTYTAASPRAHPPRTAGSDDRTAAVMGGPQWECRLCFARNEARSSSCRVCSRIRGAPPMYDLATAAVRRHVATASGRTTASSSESNEHVANLAFAEARLKTRQTEALSKFTAWAEEGSSRGEDGAATVIQRIWRGGRVRAVVFDWALAARKARERERKRVLRAEALACAKHALELALRGCHAEIRQRRERSVAHNYGSWFGPPIEVANASSADNALDPSLQVLCEACARLRGRRQCASCARGGGITVATSMMEASAAGAGIRARLLGAPPTEALGGTLYSYWLAKEATLPPEDRRRLLSAVWKLQKSRASASLAAWKMAAKACARLRMAARYWRNRWVRAAFQIWNALLSERLAARRLAAAGSKSMAEAAAKTAYAERRSRPRRGASRGGGTQLRTDDDGAIVSIPGRGFGTMQDAHDAAREMLDTVSAFHEASTLQVLDHVAQKLFCGGAKDGTGGITPRGGGHLDWYYRDGTGARQGPFKGDAMLRWFRAGFLHDATLPVCGIGVGSRYGGLSVSALASTTGGYLSLRQAMRRALDALVEEFAQARQQAQNFDAADTDDDDDSDNEDNDDEDEAAAAFVRWRAMNAVDALVRALMRRQIARRRGTMMDFCFGAWRRRVERVRLERNLRRTFCGETLDAQLVLRARQGDLQGVRRLARLGANATARGGCVVGGGRGALHVAARYGHADVCEELVKRCGADVYAKESMFGLDALGLWKHYQVKEATWWFGKEEKTTTAPAPAPPSSNAKRTQPPPPPLEDEGATTTAATRSRVWTRSGRRAS